MKRFERGLAVLCCLLVFPIVVLKLPWLPGTVFEFLELMSSWSDHSGTAAYLQDRHDRLSRNAMALILYGAGGFSMIGLFRIAATDSPRGFTLVVWLATLFSGLSLPLFERRRIDALTDHSYVACVVYLPLCIAGLALTALAFRCCRKRRTNGEAARGRGI